MTTDKQIPEQLRDPNFGFVKLGHHSKIPFEKDWTNRPYKYDEITKWFAEGNNYGVMGGLGDLIVIDTDTDVLSDILFKEFPETFTVKTSKGYHFYFSSTVEKKKIIFSENGEHLGELISCGFQVVAPLCMHPSGIQYSIERDIPICELSINLTDTSLNKFMVRPVQQNIKTTECNSVTNIEYPPSDADVVAEKCPFISEFKKTGFADNEPAWHDALGVVRHCQDGYAKCHEFSSADPKYNTHETETKLNNLEKRNIKPILCKTIGQYGFCANCKFKERVNTPITLGINNGKDFNYHETVERLAELSPLEYDRVRKDEAKKLNIRVSTLDEAVKAKNQLTKMGDSTDIFENGELGKGIEPYSLSVNGGEIAIEIKCLITKHVILPEEQICVITLWILGTYCFDCFCIYPRLLITSPLPRCGKSTLLAIISCLVLKRLMASNITPSAIFRSIEKWKPTMIIDEADTFMKDNEELRGVINSGHSKDTAFVVRVEGDSKKREPKSFSTWTPMVIGMIKYPAATIVDRSIIISIKRKNPKEKVEKLEPNAFDNFKILRQKLKRWANDNFDVIKSSKPNLPECDNDRAIDNWTPLFAIASVLGENWVNLISAAFKSFTVTDYDESPSTRLLSDIKLIFEQIKDNKLHSDDLVFRLNALEEGYWNEFNYGKSLSKNGLAKMLKSFGIKSHQVWSNDSNKNGYALEDLQDAFTRYLSISHISPDQNSRTLEQPPETIPAEKINSKLDNDLEFQKELESLVNDL